MSQPVDDYTVTVAVPDLPAVIAVADGTGTTQVVVQSKAESTTVLIEQPVETIAIASPEYVEVGVEDPSLHIIQVDDVPSGPRGPAGSAGSYLHTQDQPATVWTIQHNLGYDPAGVAVFSDGYQCDGFVTQYLQAGASLRLSFDIPLAGTARLS